MKWSLCSETTLTPSATHGYFNLLLIPRPEFKPHSKGIVGYKIIKPMIRQYMTPIRQTGPFVLHHDGESQMRYANFVKVAKERERRFGTLTVKQAEDKFWEHHREHNGVDLPLSLFDDDCEWWNLSKFTHAESLLHQISNLLLFYRN